MERELKFKYYFKNMRTGEIRSQIYALEAFENFSSMIIPMGYTLIARAQYTGIKDKNDREIYEEDVVSFEHNLKVPVYYRYGCFFVGKHEELKLGIICHVIEVVGNIYKNPELLHRE